MITLINFFFRDFSQNSFLVISNHIINSPFSDVLIEFKKKKKKTIVSMYKDIKITVTPLEVV